MDERGTSGRFSRRSLLAAAGATGLTLTAGCFDSVLSSGAQPVEPEEPSDPRAGTPGEFYTLLERNDLTVESLTKEGETLYLTYESGAATEAESMEEMGIVVEVFNANLVQNDAGIEMVIAEVSNPFDGQAHGWGVEASWLRAYNSGEEGEQYVWGSVLSSRVDGDGEKLAESELEETDGENRTDE